MTNAPHAESVVEAAGAQADFGPPGAMVSSSSIKPASGPLSHIPIFAAVSPAEQQALLDAMHLQRFEANQTIFWRGDEGDSFYLISIGQVAVTVPNDDGRHVTLDHLGPGRFFGEISLLDGGPRTATVRTTQPTEVYVLSRDDFHAFLRKHPDVSIQILTVMGQRQRASTEALRGMKNPNLAFEQSRVTLWQHTADLIATIAANQWFLLTHVVWFASWIGFNLLTTAEVLPQNWAFDPFPFGLLTMVVSLEAIFLAIFVLVSQGRQSEKDRLRTDLDYQVNVKAQTEIMNLTRKLDRVESLLREASEKKKL